MARVTGRIELILDGRSLINKEGAVARGIGRSGEPNFELEPVLYDGGLAGFSEMPVLAECEVTIIDRDDVDLDEIARVRENGTLIFRAARGGKSYTMPNATCTRNFELTGGKGEVKVKFIGPYWIEGTTTAL